MMNRRDDWAERLAAVIEAARARPYALGESDCFRLACEAIEAVTGVERWSEFRGTYKTRRQALARIAEHGNSWDAAAEWFFGGPAIDVRMARRGDCVSIREDGEMHLGVCLGRESIFTAPAGIRFTPTLDCVAAWRVG